VAGHAVDCELHHNVAVIKLKQYQQNSRLQPVFMALLFIF